MKGLDEGHHNQDFFSDEIVPNCTRKNSLAKKWQQTMNFFARKYQIIKKKLDEITKLWM